MKSDKDSGRRRGAGSGPSSQAVTGSRASARGLGAQDWFAIALGLLLGLALVKFGNPVVLDSKIDPPVSLEELKSYPWPPRWSFGLLIPFAIGGGWLAARSKVRWGASRWLWLLPLIWLGWQFLSATQTVDGHLTALTLWHFVGCVVCYFLGALVLRIDRHLHLLLIGLLAAFAFSLVRAANQKLFEFPEGLQSLVESERAGWTNLPPDVFLEWKQQGTIITTNGVDIANPVFIAKYQKGRVHGTLVYPNALAGVELLLWPATLVLAFSGTKRFRKLTRAAAIAITSLLGAAVLYWTGSKSGWLIAMALGGMCLFRLKWPVRAKIGLLLVFMVGGLTVFGVRFSKYFASGATSVGARFDYWRAAGQTTAHRPLFGSGPGTFQRSYEQLKAPESEMARLTHNDYLEQFSDSGIVGGLSYLAWIALLLATLGRSVWKLDNPLYFALFLGLFGWFIQGFSEFGLYIPALAWTAFILAGCLMRLTANQIDKRATAI